MPFSVAGALDVLRAHDINPLDRDPREYELPEIGEIGDEEEFYGTSVADILGESDGDWDGPNVLDTDDRRVREWWDEIESISTDDGRAVHQARRRILGERERPFSGSPLDICAWYAPIHFFGIHWGIYIREHCILEIARDIAATVEWRKVGTIRPADKARQLLRSAF